MRHKHADLIHAWAEGAEEPKYVEAMRSLGKTDPAGYGDLVDYIDTLRDLLKRESARADAENREVLRLTVERNTAEAKLAAMLKLGEEPSEEMKKMVCHEFWVIHVFKSVFAKLVEQAGVKK